MHIKLLFLKTKVLKKTYDKQKSMPSLASSFSLQIQNDSFTCSQLVVSYLLFVELVDYNLKYRPALLSYGPQM